MSKRTSKEPSLVKQVAEKTGAASQVRAQFAHYQEGNHMSNAAKDVLAERQRQISAEGWTPEHDDEHIGGEMALAASCYAAHTGADTMLHAKTLSVEWHHKLSSAQEFVGRHWPWARTWWKPKDRRSNLVRAAALLIAEIERIDRAKSRVRPDGFPTWICIRCTSPGYCSGSLQGCDIEEMSK